MKRKIFILIIVSWFIAILYAENPVEKTIKNDFINISDISIKRLRAAEKDDSSIEDFYYQQKIWKAENKLKESMESQRIKSVSINGNWNLYDITTNQYYSDNNGVYIGRTISFTDTNGFCNYQHQASNSYVYKQNDNIYIVFPTYDAGIIRLLLFDNDKLYIYNLDGDTWYLDDIHKSGNYYKRH